MKNKKFYRKILWMFLIISIVPTSLIGIITSFSMKKIIEDKMIKEAQAANIQSLEMIETALDTYVKAIDSLMEQESIQAYLKSTKDLSRREFHETVYFTVAQFFDESKMAKSEFEGGSFVKKMTNVHVIHATSAQIMSLYHTPKIYDYPKNRNWGIYRHAQNTTNTVVYFSRYKDEENREMIATAIRPYWDEKEVIGYIAMDIPLEVLKAQTNQSSDRLPLYFTLTTDQAYILWDENSMAHSANFLQNQTVFSNKGYYTSEKNKVLMSYSVSERYKIILFGGFNLELLLGNLQILWKIWLVTVIILLLLCIITAFKIAKAVENPLRKLESTMKKVEKGNFDVSVEINSNDEFGYVAKQFNAMCGKIKDLFEKNEEKQKMLRMADIKKMQAQINPHFLYNTLDSIKYLAKMNDQEEIFVMIKSLNSLLKNAFNLSKEFTTLKESIDNLSSYITIQKIRFSDKFDVCFEVPETLYQVEIPNLILQPIIENAILHGLEPLHKQGSLKVEVKYQEKHLAIAISDTGIGMTEEQCSELIQSLDQEMSHSHIGLKNVHQRLKLYYGPKYGLTIESTKEKGTTVYLKIPWKEEYNYDTLLNSGR
ncbi:MAG: histidine kinase [Eubacteriales bacterium]|nr:histidine kinase [Eubacteriales bacterium]